MATRNRKRTADGGGDNEDGSRKAVFMTAELLEDILMHLPLKELSVAQGACRRFREVVTTSAKLQQKLFLRPSALGLTEKWTMFVVENPDKEDGLELIRLHGDGNANTEAPLGFTIGSLLDAILGTELDRLWYFDGYKDVTLRKTTPGKLLTRLEKKTGLKVMVTFWQLDLHDLILAVGEEQQ
ncbi:hypothetical protein B0A54_15319 [Friedmanniomyces endolithicus]|uniref:F-box domain-containing protein n=1 Tax=Friedmanniomyces endolithicus TaxID=329885 RepID=A0A4U0U863_9PEZI|nr:hypothetical protein B0A54_15319 [Friedmanniomyces endolithicus]